MAGVGEEELNQFFADVAKRLVEAGYDMTCGELKVEIIEAETPGEDSQMIFTW